MDGVETRKTTVTGEPLDWNSASAKKRSFNLGISSLKDSVELYARRPIIIPLYNFKNPFGVKILQSESVCIAGIVPFDGCRYSDIYLLSNADMNKVMQSNPLVLNTPMNADALKNYSAIVDLTNNFIFGYVYGYVKSSVERITQLCGLTPIIYDDGNYSYSSLNLINMDGWSIAPFELIESVQAGK